MIKKNKKPVRRDGFRGQPDFIGASLPFTFRPTEDDARKRIIQKRPIPKKK